MKYKNLVFALSFLILALQFYRPTKNISNIRSDNSIEFSYNTSEDVRNILKMSCYDCHSNNSKSVVRLD